MAKKQENVITEKTPEQTKVLRLIRDDIGAYGFEVYEVPVSALGKPVEKSLPDIFAICLNDLNKKARELFGI